MTQWPRRITRGRLAGKTYASEGAYRKDYQKASGVTRYQQRQARAKGMGYESYYQRRQTKELAGGLTRKQENKLQAYSGRLSEPLQLRVLPLLKDFGNMSKKERIAEAQDIADDLGVDVKEVYALLYMLIGTG